MKKRIIFFAITFLLTILIFIYSLTSGSASENQSGGIADFIASIFGDALPLITYERLVRKLAHFFEYFALAFFWVMTFALFTKKKAFWFITLAICFITSLLDEFVFQALAEGRRPLFTDCIIDFSGSWVCFFIFLIIVEIIDYKKVKE